jgi:sporulation protein YlmC with PRC-barrel domain
MDTVNDDTLRGRPVIDANGRVLGDVDGFSLDRQSLRLSSLRVKLRKEVARDLGQRYGAFRGATLEVSVEFVSAVGDAVVLNRTVETFTPEAAAAPTPGP